MRSRREVPHRFRSTSWSKRRRCRCGSKISCTGARTRNPSVRCLYLGRSDALFVVDDPRLDGTTERHQMDLTLQPLQQAGAIQQLLISDRQWEGVILEMFTGWPGRHRLRVAAQAVALGRRVWLHYPEEKAVEVVDEERLQSHWRHWWFITV